MKLVGGDSGRYEREELVESVLIAPSERAVVDVLFDEPGPVTLEHRTPDRTYSVATITVGDERAEPSLASLFARLRTNSDMVAERARIAPYLNAEPDKTLALVAEMDMGEPQLPPGATVAYVCPMHAEVKSDEPGRCPTCGMKLVAREAAPIAYVCPMHPGIRSERPDRCPECGMKLVPAHLAGESAHDEHEHDHSHGEDDEHAGGEHAQETNGIEWEDDMVEVNRITTPANMRWKLIDRARELRSTGGSASAIG